MPSEMDEYLELEGPSPMAAVTMSGRAIRQDCFKAVERHSPIVFPKTALRLQQAKFNGLPQQMLRNGKEQSKPLTLVALALDSSDISISSPSPSKAISQFYTSINEKDLKQLGKLLADDSFFDDYSFPKPFEGKQVSFLFYLHRSQSCFQYLTIICK